MEDFDGNQDYVDHTTPPLVRTPAPSTVVSPRRSHRLRSVMLLGLTLAGGAVGGGAVGATLTARSLTAAAAETSVVAAQPVAQTAPSNVAGAVLSAVGPSVVEITIGGQGSARQFSPSGTGSGFVVDASGLIMTNQHVVSGASSVSVEFSTGEQRSATIVGTDRSNDLALLRVNNMPSGIPAVTLGDSAQVEVGETAIAIGSPFGLELTVTQGIISAIDRNWSPDGRLLRGLIQTDAPINPGNSGGPLLNERGEVIGINTLIESPVGGNVGIGFAVPINVAKQQLTQLQAGANLQQGYMGVSLEEATANGQAGVTIGTVEQGSGAAQAGLRVGDLITAINGNAITDYESLVAQISGKQPGEKVTVTIGRNGQEQQVEVTLLARPEQPIQ